MSRAVVLWVACIAVCAEARMMTYKWSRCDGNGTLGQYFSSNFGRLESCQSISAFAPIGDFERPLSPMTTSSCFKPLTEQFHVNDFSSPELAGTIDCNHLAAALLESYVCALGRRTENSYRAQVTELKLNFTSTICHTPADTESFRVLQAMNFVLRPFEDQLITAHCLGSRVQLRSCYQEGPDRVLEFPLWVNNECNGYGLQVRCTACLPLASPDVITQPYVFLLFPGVKLVLMKLFELFVLFQLAERLRHTLERRLRERPIESGTHPPALAAYVNKYLLHNGQRRIRQRLTSRNRDGKKNVKRLLKRFELEVSEGKEHAPLTKEEWTELVNPQGIWIQSAAFTKAECVEPCVRALQTFGVVADANDDDVRDNEVLDWFFDEVCAFGAYKMQDSEASFEMLRGSIEKQLVLLSRRRTLALARHRDAQREPFIGDTITIDGVAIPIAALQSSSQPMTQMAQMLSATNMLSRIQMLTSTARSAGGHLREPANDCRRRERHKMKHKHAKKQQAVKGTFAEDFDRELAIRQTAESQTHVVEVALRSVVKPLPFEEEEEHSVVCDETVTLQRVADSLVLALYPDGAPFIHVEFFRPGTRDLIEHDREIRDLLHPDATRVCLRYKLRRPTTANEPIQASSSASQLLQPTGLHDTVFSNFTPNAFAPTVHVLYHDDLTEEEHFIEPFSSIDEQLEKMRDAFEGNVARQPATYDGPWLEKDSDQNLARILDGRASTSAMEFMLSLCGEEVVYECDVTPTERYELRDAIPQLSAAQHEQREKYFAVHGIDPRPTYDLCYEYLTVYHTWDRQVRHGVLLAYETEREKVLSLLSSMYDLVKDRLLSDQKHRLEDASCHAIANQFKPHIEDVSRLVHVVSIGEQVVLTIFAVNVYILAASIAFGIAYFVLSVVNGIDDPAANGWERYENIYFRFVNSGTPASILASSSVNMLINTEARHKSRFLAVLDYGLFAIAVVLVLPPLVTHVIPGLFAYLWIVASAVFILCIPIAILRNIYVHYEKKWKDEFMYSEHELIHNHRRLKTYLVVIFMLVSFVGMVVLTAAFQSCFNWLFLLYHHSERNVNYITTLRLENDGRTIECYWEDAVATSFNSMQMVSSFVG
jgi:hypothetical protein